MPMDRLKNANRLGSTGSVAGPSTAPLAVGLREASLRMTAFYYLFVTLCLPIQPIERLRPSQALS